MNFEEALKATISREELAMQKGREILEGGN